MAPRPHSLYVRDEGAGPALVFVHGFPLDHTMWDEAVDAFAPSQRCIAVDLRGFGRSTPAGAPLLSMETHADDLARALDALDVERAHVCALSMGGYVALAFAERHAARLRTLTLVDSRAEGEDEAGRAKRDAAAAHLLDVGRAAFAREMLAKLVAPSAGPSVRARLLSLIEATPYESIVAALMGMKVRPDRMGVLRGLAVPLLVVCGEEDVLTPPALSRAMAAAHPSGELSLVPGAGHMSPMERPAAFHDALGAFLARHR